MVLCETFCFRDLPTLFLSRFSVTNMCYLGNKRVHRWLFFQYEHESKQGWDCRRHVAGLPCCRRRGILYRGSDATGLRCSALHPHPHMVPGHSLSLLGVKASHQKPSPLHSWRKQGPGGLPLRQALCRLPGCNSSRRAGSGGRPAPRPAPGLVPGAPHREGLGTCHPRPGAALGHLVPRLLEAGRYTAPQGHLAALSSRESPGEALGPARPPSSQRQSLWGGTRPRPPAGSGLGRQP